MRLPPGTTLGDLRIVERLGRGGMAEVYLAEHRGLGRRVALKLLAPELARDPRQVERFLREARSAALVRHPNVVPLLDAGHDGGVAWIAFELVTGGTLVDLVRASGRLPWREAARLGAGIARGLAAVHARGLVHRDVKPGNVLLDERGTPLVADFGLARVVGGATDLTRTGELIGTLEYLAPEQAEAAARVDARADLYALGAVLFTLVAGRPPFDGAGYELLKKHLMAEPPPVPEAPPAFGALVQRLLAKKPALRPRSAEEVAAALDRLAAGETGRLAWLLPVGLVALAAVSAGVTAVTRPAAPSVASTSTTPSTSEWDPCATFRETDALRLVRVLGGFENRHAGEVWSVALAPSERLAATGDELGWVRVWELPSFRERRAFRASGTQVHALTFLDEERLLVGDLEGVASLWEPGGSRVLHRGRGPIYALPVRGGRVLVPPSEDDAFVTVELASGRKSWTPGRGAAGAAFLDDERALVGHRDGRVAVWDVARGRLDRVLGQHAALVPGVAVSEGRAASAGLDGSARLYDLASGALVASHVSAEAGFLDVKFAPDGRLVLAGTAARAVVWDAATGTTRVLPHSHGAWVKKVAVSRAGRVLTAHFQRAGWFDLASAASLASYVGHSMRVTQIRNVENGRAISTGRDGRAIAWEPAKGTHRVLYEDSSWLNGMGWGPRFVVASWEHGLRQIDPATGALMTDLPKVRALSVDSSPARDRILAGRGGGLVGEWHEHLVYWPFAEATPIPPGSSVAGVAYLDDDLAASADDAGRLVIWNAKEKAERSLLGHHVRPYTALARVDRERLLVSDASGAVALVSVPDRRIDVAFAAHGAPTTALGTDGTYALSASADGLVRLWRVRRELEPVGAVSLAGAGDHATALAVEPDGRHVLVGTCRGAILRFELRR